MKKLIFIFMILVVLVVTSSCGGEDFSTQKGANNALEFELSEDGRSYYVTGIGSFNGTDLMIPNTHRKLPVTQIQDYAFESCENIETVTIGKNITHIGERAFYKCDNIKEVTFNAIRCDDCESSPFGDLGWNLTRGASVTIGKDVERIPAYLFGKGIIIVKSLFPNCFKFRWQC